MYTHSDMEGEKKEEEEEEDGDFFPDHCYSDCSPPNIFGWRRRRRGRRRVEIGERGTSARRGGGRSKRGRRRSIMQEDGVPRKRAVITIQAKALILLWWLVADCGTAAAVSSTTTATTPSSATTTTKVMAELSGLENCFALTPKAAWPLAMVYDREAAAARLDLKATGPEVLSCLNKQWKYEEKERKGSPMLAYKLDLLRQNSANRSHLQSSEQASLARLVDATNEAARRAQVVFHYLLFAGAYRVRFRLCQVGDDEEGRRSIMCKENDDEVLSGNIVELEENLADAERCRQNASWVAEADAIPGGRTRLIFTIFYPPCLENASSSSFPSLPYERVTVALIATESKDVSCRLTPGDNSTWSVRNSSTRIGSNVAGTLAKARYDAGVLPETGETVFYCLTMSQDEHPLCTDGVEPRPIICSASSPWIAVEPAPLLARYLPFCQGHLDCAWLYLTAVCLAALAVACALALCCVYCDCRRCCCCCCRRKGGSPRRRRRHSLIRADEGIPFDCLNELGGVSAANSLRPKKTWAELHSEWDAEPPKNPGKILLLYSPDSVPFRDLQAAFKSFLELACHCVVLDLFDDELFQTIAFDPEQWLTTLMQDPDFKAVVVCSKGAFKRQQAILSKEVLNIPDNSTLDGLFSAALKFMQSQKSYDFSNRLCLARYEPLPSCAPEYRLVLSSAPSPREFLVPTGLHDLFCWIHGYEPLDLLGKPWARYHLELQLLTDSIRKAKQDEQARRANQ